MAKDLIWTNDQGRRVWDQILENGKVQAALEDYRSIIATEVKKLSRCYCAESHNYGISAIPTGGNKRAWAASSVWGKHVYSRVVLNPEAIEAWSQGITNKVMFCIDDYLDEIALRSLNKEPRQNLIRVFDGIAIGFVPGRHVRKDPTLSPNGIEMLLFLSSGILPVLRPSSLTQEANLPIRDFVRATAALVPDAEASGFQFNRMLQTNNLFIPSVFKCKIPDRVKDILHQARCRDDGEINIKKFRRQLQPEEREAVRVAAGVAAYALRCMFQISAPADDNSGSATVHNWMTASPEYALLRDVIRTVWDEKVGKPERDGGLERGPGGNVDECDAIKNVFAHTFDLIELLCRYVDPAVAAHANCADDDKREYFANLAISQYSKGIVLRYYTAYLHAFLDRTRVLCNCEDDIAKWRIVRHRIFPRLRDWRINVEAAFAAADPRPNKHRKSPFGVASPMVRVPDIALKAALYVIDVPGNQERLAAPDVEVLDALIESCTGGDRALAAAWLRLRRLSPLNFF